MSKTQNSIQILKQIKAQKALSEDVLAALLPIIQEFYYPDHAQNDIVCGDLGSFARGTNNSRSPDLDLGFFGASNDEARGYKDWTPIGTRELTGRKEGLTSLEELSQYDPRMAQAIQQIQPTLETYFGTPPGSARFNFMRSWEGYPGWVCNFSLPHPQYGTIEFDINLAYTPSHYGLEHAQRFERYLARVVAELGPEAAAQLIEDIRRVKKQGKEKARNPEGWVDRTKKIAGFVVEGLLMHQYPPHTYTEVMELVLAHKWESSRMPTEHWLGDQADQVIDCGLSFSELLENMACDNDALPKGAWENLLSIAQEYEANDN